MKKLLLLLGLLLLCGCTAKTVPVMTDASAESAQPTMTVALTFDDGPNSKYTPRLLDGLKERDIHATFFLVGELAETNDALVWRIAAEGHQIGNHSYDHCDLSKATEWEAKQDIQKCSRILCDILGNGEYWVRPPYGFMNDAERSTLSTPVINWSVDTEDWKSKNVEQILDIIYRDCFDGCIILMHDRYETSVEAALRAIDHLCEQGVQFVTVQELFARKGVVPEAGKVYRSAK